MRVFELDDVFHTRLRAFFIDALAMHVSRWNYPRLDLEVSHTKWMKTINDYFDKKQSNSCRCCFLKLFRMKCNESIYVDDNEPIKRIDNPKIHIPKSIIIETKKRMVSMKVDRETLPLPCICKKF